MSGQISLNSVEYSLAKDQNGKVAIRRYTIQEEPNVASPDGQQSQSRFINRTFINFPVPIY